MPNPRSGAAAAEFRNNIYLIGGVPAVQGPVSKTVQEYDPITDKWTKKADMPTPRTALAVTLLDAKIYAIGGTSAVQGPGLTTVEIYDPLADTWKKTIDMPTARVFLGAATINTKIYAIGGVLKGLGPEILPTVEEFNLGTLSVAALDKTLTLWGKIKTGLIKRSFRSGM